MVSLKGGPPTPLKPQGKVPEGYQTSVKLLGQKWRIKYSRCIKDEDGQRLMGYSDHRARTIAIDTACSPGAMLDTLVHEILHSYYRMLPGLTEGLQLSNDEDAAEEAIVVANTTAILDLLSNNKWVRDLLCRG